MTNKQITLNDLPKYSPWPARMLGFEGWEVRKKTSESIKREFDVEKWGKLLKEIKENRFAPTLDNVSRHVFKDIGMLPCYKDDRIVLMSAGVYYEEYIDVVEKELLSYTPAGGIVELGAGYGAVILNLAKRRPFRGCKIIAGEYVGSGRKIIGVIAEVEDIGADIYCCDLSAEKIIDGDIAEGAIIFTSYAVHYVSVLKDQFVDSLLELKPVVVIHFEPCYEHYDGQNLMGLMRRKYVELNDYNRNLVSILHRNQVKGKIKVIKEKPMVMGDNPFLPMSIIAWKPV